MVPGFDIRQLLTMTDRQILITFFPDQLPKPPAPSAGITYKEAFWKINRNRGLYESQIQAEWLRQTGRPLT